MSDSNIAALRPSRVLTALHRPHWSLQRTLVFAIAMAGLLAAAGALVQISQNDARKQFEERFDLRVGLGATFVESFLLDVAERERRFAQTELAASEVAPGGLERAAAALGFDVAVLLDDTGRVIQVVPDRPELVGTNLADKYDHLRRATQGEVAISNVVASAAKQQPVMAVATPFDTPFGRRVFSGGFLVSTSPLAAYLRATMPFSSSVVALVDSKNTIVATNETDGRPVDTSDIEPPLNAAGTDGRTGHYAVGSADRFFSLRAISGTPLRLVATVDSPTLYLPMGGMSQWLPWVVLGGLVLIGLYLLHVLSALSRTQDRLHLATAELARSNRELEGFAGIASHDLQEPLRKIQSFSDRVATRAGTALDDESRDYLVRVQDAASRMQTLIQDLLAWSRVSSRPETFARVDLQKLVDDVVSDLETAIESRSGTVEVGELPTVDASPLQMRQLFQNLIANGLKFRRPDTPPVVVVTTQRKKGAWAISVADNGIGFDDRYVDRIFAPFERLHGRNEYEGTGMGLAICRRIVERHGGQLTAHGEPGKGATFLIELPVAKQRSGRPVKGATGAS